MTTETELHSLPIARIETLEASQRLPPPWFAQLLVLMRVVDHDGLRDAVMAIHIETAHAGRFETLDVVVALLAHVISAESHLKDTFEALLESMPTGNTSKRALLPFAAVLPALWNRDQMLSRSTLSRRLTAMPESATEALRSAFSQDLHIHGLKTEQMGGLFDRTGQRHFVFYQDGTVQTARQRALNHDPSRPAPKRRRTALMAKGYPGRKRACVLRTRLAIHNAHTGEWLGTFGHRGNTALARDLCRGNACIVTYLAARQLPVAMGMVCLDGLYGHAQHISLVDKTGLGWLVRCVDYRLLTHPQVMAALAQQIPSQWTHPDTAVTRQVYEVGSLSWPAAKGEDIGLVARLVVTLREPTAKERCGKPRIGIRVGQRIAELFATNQNATAFSAIDIVQLYLYRGAFERELGAEDQRTDPDRFVSGNPAGQEFFQILCQYIDNVRLRLGVQTEQACVRTLLFSEAHTHSAVPVAQTEPEALAEADRGSAALPPYEPVPTTEVGGEIQSISALAPAQSIAPALPMPSGSSAAPSVVLPKTELGPTVARSPLRGAATFGGTDFVFDEAGVLRCPAGRVLRPFSSGVRDARKGIRYEAKGSDCRGCSLAVSCLGKASPTSRNGRRVTVHGVNAPVQPASSLSGTPAKPPVVPAQAPPPSAASVAAPVVPVCGEQPVLWRDIPSIGLRQRWTRALEGQMVQLQPVVPAPVPERAPWESRDQRAHRRLRWTERVARNASRPDTQWRVIISGVSSRLAAQLGSHGPPGS